MSMIINRQSTSKILPCKCPHDYQDAVYGKDKRVHNQTKQSAKDSSKYRCTVCGSEK